MSDYLMSEEELDEYIAKEQAENRKEMFDEYIKEEGEYA